MKALWIVLSAVLAACALGAGVMWQSEFAQLGTLADQITQLKAENARLTDKLAAETEKANALEAESQQLRAARAIAQTPVSSDPSPEPTPDQSAKTTNMGGFFAKMMKDPDMKKMMAAQQATVMRRYYADFLKSANLTPDETAKFYQLLEDRQTALMDSGFKMMSGSGADLNAAAAATNTSNDAISQLLGPVRYSQYQDYEKTLGDRIEVDQFNQQLSADGAALQDNQSAALIQIMAQETGNMPGMGAPGSPGSNPLSQGGLSQSDLQQYSQQMEAADQRVYNRAMGVLSPPQLTAFGNYQKTMEIARVAGLKMAREMIKGN